MLIGIVAALKEEIQSLVDALDDARVSKWGGRPLHEGSIGDCRVVAMTCGIGKVRAAACTQYLIDQFSLEALLCTGVAGAVDPRLGVGDIIIAERALQHDFALGEPQLLKRQRKRWLMADARLMELALQAGKDLGFEDRLHLGTVLTGDQAVSSQEKRRWLWDTFAGDCVDMESAAVAQVCQHNNVPFVIVRAISDSATEEAVTEFKQGFARTADDAARIALGILERLSSA